MATVISEINQAGTGDYTSIAAWESAANLNSGADIWKGEISDTTAYDEAVILNAGGTSVTSHLWLTAAAGNAHSGTAGTGHARISYSGGNTAAIEIDEPADYAYISSLEIDRTNLGNSDEGVRVTNADHVLLSRLIIWASDTSPNRHSDGIYIRNAATPTFVDHCLIYNWGRACIHAQNPGTRTTHIDHCALLFSGHNTGSDEYGVLGSSESTVDTMNVYNTVVLDNVGSETVEIAQVGAGAFTLNGSHNIVTADSATYIGSTITDNATNWQAAGDQVTDTAPATAGYYITESNIPTLDATPIDHANNVAIANGTNRQGSEPDSRQDFSLDLAGNARPTTNVDIGPLQVSTAGGGTTDLATSATGNLTATVDAGHRANLATSATADLTATADADHRANLATSATGDLTATVDADVSTVLATTATGNLTVTANATAGVALSTSATANLSATVDTTLSTVLATSATANLTATADADLTTNLATSATGNLTATVGLSGEVTLSTSATGSLTATVDADLTTNLATDATGELTATVALDGSVDLATSATGNLTATVDASKVSTLATSATGNLTATVDASKVVNLASDAQTALSAAANAQVVHILATAATGALSGSVDADQTTNLATTATGDLTATVALQGLVLSANVFEVLTAEPTYQVLESEPTYGVLDMLDASQPRDSAEAYQVLLLSLEGDPTALAVEWGLSTTGLAPSTWVAGSWVAGSWSSRESTARAQSPTIGGSEASPGLTGAVGTNAVYVRIGTTGPIKRIGTIDIL